MTQGINDLTFALFGKYPSESMILGDIKFENVRIETMLHGGFGPLYASFAASTHEAYKWYHDYYNYRLKAYDSRREVAWEGRIEDIRTLPGRGLSITGFGYWRNCFDMPMKDEETWDDDDEHYPDDIIRTIIQRCCRQIVDNFNDFADINRNVAPWTVSGYRYPADLIQELLEGGDKWGTPAYFAVWEDQEPHLFLKDSTVKWLVRVEDCLGPPELTRSMEDLATAVLIEYTVEGKAGDVNDSGTATGERANNYVTLTDSGQGWDEGQWDSGFDIAIVGGTGSGQIRDVLTTRMLPEVVDSGRVVPLRYGTIVAQEADCQKMLVGTGGATQDGQFTWRLADYEDEPLWADIISGVGSGQKREINGDMAWPNYTFVYVTPDWDGEGTDGDQYPGHPAENAGGKYLIYKPNTLVTQGKSWVHQQYNTGYMVEIVKGRGASQRRKITDTKPYVTLDGSWDMLVLDEDWETQPDETSYFEIHKQVEVMVAGKATGGSYNTLVDESKKEDGSYKRNWTVGQYDDDYEVVITNGACSGQKARIVDTAIRTLTVEPLWDNDIPDDTSEYEIRKILEKEDEEAKDGHCTQVVMTTEWTTQPDDTSEYEIRQKEDGGELDRTDTFVTGQAARDLNLSRKKVYSIGKSTPANAKRVGSLLRKKLKEPLQRGGSFTISKVYNRQWSEQPLVAVRAGDTIEIVDLFEGQEETEDFDNMRRFFIMKTVFDASAQTLAITPDNVETNIATLIASARR